MSVQSPYSADSHSDTSSIVGYPAIGEGGIRDVDIIRSRFLDVGMYCGMGIAPLSKPYNRASAASFDRQVDQEQSAGKLFC